MIVLHEQNLQTDQKSSELEANHDLTSNEGGDWNQKADPPMCRSCRICQVGHTQEEQLIYGHLWYTLSLALQLKIPDIPFIL